MIKLDETLLALHAAKDPEVRKKRLAHLAPKMPDHDVVYNAGTNTIEIYPKVVPVVHSLKPTLVGLKPIT